MDIEKNIKRNIPVDGYPTSARWDFKKRVRGRGAGEQRGADWRPN